MTDKRKQSQSKAQSKAKVVVKKKTQKEVNATLKHTKFNPEIHTLHKHFQDFIEKDLDDESRFVCKACKEAKKSFYSGYYDNLADHLQTSTHNNVVLALNRSEEIQDAVKEFVEFRGRKSKKKVIKADKTTLDKLRIEVTAFMLDHQLPFIIAPSLIEFTQDILKKYGDSAIQELSMSNVTASQITRQTICKALQDSIFEDMQNSFFSLSIDECSDKYGPSYLCVHTRYIKDEKIQNKLLSLNEIKESSTGEDIFEIIINETFQNKEYLLQKNLIGICIDMGPNMLTTKGKELFK